MEDIFGFRPIEVFLDDLTCVVLNAVVLFAILLSPVSLEWAAEHA
jgi:hypothetical protein